MIVIKLMGGLGNQLFQWALGFSLKKRGHEVRYDISAYENNAKRQYWLGPIDDLIFDQSTTRHFYEKSHIFDPYALIPADGRTMIGYWQAEQYFTNYAENIRHHVNLLWAMKPLVGQAKEIQKEIFASHSVFLHVRRQDYLGLQHFHGLLDMNYYRSAVNTLSEKHTNLKFFVFSDDREWCRQTFTADNFKVVDYTDMYEDLQLMADCKHAILANSSFSWWGAWLGDNQQGRTVIAPRRWFTSPDVDDRDLVPSRWLKI
jgi:hypothetical protein